MARVGRDAGLTKRVARVIGAVIVLGGIGVLLQPYVPAVLPGLSELR